MSGGESLDKYGDRRDCDEEAEPAETAAIGQILPPGAVHQGVGLRIPPLAPIDLDDLGADPGGVLIMLDQVTDPQNIGAIFRSAAAFGARGVILQDRHAPLLTGADIKAVGNGNGLKLLEMAHGNPAMQEALRRQGAA